MSAAQKVEQLCEIAHNAYEAAAVDAGWETQERSRKPWAEVPEANKETMRAAIRAVLDALGEPTVEYGVRLTDEAGVVWAADDREIAETWVSHAHPGALVLVTRTVLTGEWQEVTDG